MPIINIPLTHGLNESVDTKLMPAGFLARAENIRFRKDGRMGSRFGYDFISGSLGRAIAAGNFGASRSVYIGARTNSSTPATWWEHFPSGDFSPAAHSTAVGNLGVPQRIGVVRNQKLNIQAADMLTAGNFVWCVYNDTDNSTNNGLSYLILDRASLSIVTSGSVSATGFNPRLVAVGSSIIFTWGDAANAIKYVTFNATTAAVTSGPGTIATASAGTAAYFDVCANDSSTALMAYQSGGAVLEWGTLSTAGVYTRKATQVIANNARASIAKGATSGNTLMVWNEGAAFTTGNCNYGTWNSAGTVVVAKTAVDSSGNVCGYPVAGSNADDDWSFAWNIKTTGPCGCGVFTNGKSIHSIYPLVAVSRPFSAFNGTFMWLANFAGVSAGTPGGLATYYLVDIESVGASASNAIVEASACQYEAFAGNYYLLFGAQVDPRRNSGAATAVSGLTGATATLTALPVRGPLGYGLDAIRIESGTFIDKLLPANINGQLFFSGGRVREYDGRRVYETGMQSGPEEVTAVDAGAGTIGAGTYQYSVIWQWNDKQGRRHRSPPSVPVSVTIAASHNVTVSVTRPPFSDKFDEVTAVVGMSAKIYRTLAGGTIFYQVNTASNVVTGTGSTYLTYTDSSTDAAIAVNETLYTQGARGGLSGLLPNDEPPSAAFIWAGNNRLLLGGLEDRTAVQWSKLVFPGEPVQFTINAGFRANVDGEVTAVAAMDGAWYVFTRDSVWVITGDGPDDNGGGGFFSDPRKLPSDVGCISQRSVLETSQGLFFQARSDRMYLVPRGGGSPVFVGQPVRDQLTSFPQIMWARVLPDENLAVWAIQASDGSTGRLLVYDLRISEWCVDKIFTGTYLTNTLDVYGGKLVLNGELAETSAWTDDTTGAETRVIQMTISLGEFRPFGAMGWGRVRRMNLLTENRCASSSILPDIDVSVNGGVSYEQSSVYTLAAGAGQTAPFVCAPKTVRGSSWIFRIISGPQTPDEGLVFNAVSLEVFPSESGPLLSSAQMG